MAIAEAPTTLLMAQLAAARRAAAPLIFIRTPDMADTTQQVMDKWGGNGTAIVRWDIARGLVGLNDPGNAAINVDPALTTDVGEALSVMRDLPPKTIVLMLNAQRVISERIAIQGIWNLRDPFKATKRTLIMMGTDVTLPPELTGDVVTLDEPLPSDEQLLPIVLASYTEFGMDAPDDQALLTRALDATIGLPSFAAEQALYMSQTPEGLDLDDLWERKRRIIEAAQGLQVWRGGETFKDVAGYENAKEFLGRVLGGRKPPRVILFIDEIEKALGTGLDTSGVSQSMLGTLLSWMQDTSATGVIFIGPPGSGKSNLAKAAGGQAEIPTIQFDLGGMKGSLVGESEQRLRANLKVVDAVGQGDVLVIATCNNISGLPPELRRRFTFGTFFFDLPTTKERDQIWWLYRERYETDAGDLVPEDDGWTGAEIKQCCELSWRLGCSLAEASSYIVPVAVAAKDQIERLRTEASGRYISASAQGVYQKPRETTGRRMVGD